MGAYSMNQLVKNDSIPYWFKLLMFAAWGVFVVIAFGTIYLRWRDGE